MQIDQTVSTPLRAIVSEEASRLAGAVVLTATLTALGTILLPLLAVATALAWPALPLLAAIAGRERRASSTTPLA